MSTFERAEAVVADDEQTINDVRWRQTLREFYGPVMVHLPFLKLTEGVFGCHPHRIVSIRYGRGAPFHGGNTGSNPVGDAIASVRQGNYTIKRPRRCRFPPLSWKGVYHS